MNRSSMNNVPSGGRRELAMHVEAQLTSSLTQGMQTLATLNTSVVVVRAARDVWRLLLRHDVRSRQIRHSEV